MERLSSLAHYSVSRGYGFITLTIVCIGVALSFDPILAAKWTAVLTTALAVYLMFRAWYAPKTNYQRTKLWRMLSREERPVAEQAQKLTGNALSDAYMHFAHNAANVAVCLWVTAIGLHLTLPADYMPI
ncbi:hypothetical protein ACKTEK_01080 [Tepidamorphus sp. 3E244]|uniref:hypothetical protein n=1 Tax=Tepidamorphus sp. 3E244 TaxID=3385498 RepID=UPI0038FCD7DA